MQNKEGVCQAGTKTHSNSRSQPETAHLAKCECWHSWALLKCKVVIPNDHIFDERNIGEDIELCGRSVYNAVPRGWSAKSGPRCNLDRVIICPPPLSQAPCLRFLAAHLRFGMSSTFVLIMIFRNILRI